VQLQQLDAMGMSIFPCFANRRLPGVAHLVCPVLLMLGGSTASAQDKLPPLVAKVAPPGLTREAVLTWALENNPELAALRQQRGIASAGVVIARTYPFNPNYEGRFEAANGPAAAGVTNAILNEHKILLELELHGQRNYRRNAAAAALTRTEWEVARQEVLLASRVLWAFDGVLYRQEKLRLSDERIMLNSVAADQISKLREQGKLSPADLILIRTEVDDALAQRGAAELALETAKFELRRTAGTVQTTLPLEGPLEGPMLAPNLNALLALAGERRADLRARQAAIAEAEARVALENANRFGNPTVGPSYGLDATQVSSVGVTMVLPLPVLNTHRGDILQRQQEQARAVLELRQLEILVQQEVQVAVAKLQKARAWIETYQNKVLPNLRGGLEAVEKLFREGDPGTDVVRVLEIRRNLLKGSDAYLDALWEYSQARAELAAAVGDLSVVFGCEPVLPMPHPQ
jgi:outer membrane protein TolC